MLNRTTVLRSLFLSATILFSQVATAAPMKLDETMSKLNFISIKNGSVGETHSIQKLTGSLSDKGDLEVSIFLDSVETNIEIRNTRLNTHVFESEKTPIATIKANVLAQIPTSAGVSVIETEGELTMRGITKTVKVNAIVTHTGEDLVVSSVMPIIINAADYEMETGVEKLRELVNISSIATAVPVTFSLVFK